MLWMKSTRLLKLLLTVFGGLRYYFVESFSSFSRKESMKPKD